MRLLKTMSSVMPNAMGAALFTATLFTTTLVTTTAHATVADYDNCLALVDADTTRALSEAQTWRDTGGGLAAQHCIILALAKLGNFSDAATQADALSDSAPDPALQADLLTQSGEFHLAANNAAAARTVFDRALSIEPNALDALDGRARALASTGDLNGAIADLTRVLWLLPNDAEALALRAAARRRNGDIAGALNDAEAAVAADPDSAVAYFERGAVRAIQRDHNGAREDWSTAVRLDRVGDVSSIAQQNISRLPQ